MTRVISNAHYALSKVSKALPRFSARCGVRGSRHEPVRASWSTYQQQGLRYPRTTSSEDAPAYRSLSNTSSEQFTMIELKPCSIEIRSHAPMDIGLRLNDTRRW